MIETWRWFGPSDVTTISNVMQTGARGIVSALHHVADGAVWHPGEVARRQDQIRTTADGQASGLDWLVVESLPVSEDIKRQTGEWRSHIANYKTSLQKIAATGLRTVCYNFMPVIDWTRTDLHWRLPNGALCMRFDAIDFAAFDIHLLARSGAVESYDPAVVDAAAERVCTSSRRLIRPCVGPLVPAGRRRHHESQDRKKALGGPKATTSIALMVVSAAPRRIAASCAMA